MKVEMLNLRGAVLAVPFRTAAAPAFSPPLFYAEETTYEVINVPVRRVGHSRVAPLARYAWCVRTQALYVHRALQRYDPQECVVRDDPCASWLDWLCAALDIADREGLLR